MKYILSLLLFASHFMVLAQVQGSYLAEVMVNGKYGFIDTLGNEVIPPVYYEIDYDGWSDNLLAVSDDDIGIGKWGFINNKGVEIIRPKFQHVSYFKKGLAGVKINDKWGFIDTAGNMVIKPKYDAAGDFSSGRALVHIDDSTSYINRKGEEIISARYKSGSNFIRGFAEVLRDWKRSNNGVEYGGWGFIDTNGRSLTSRTFTTTSYFSATGFAKVGYILSENDDKSIYGFINTKGELVVPIIYDMAHDFGRDSMAMVGKEIDSGGEWDNNILHGYINEKGEESIKPQFSDAREFKKGYAVVANKDDDYGVIDKTGKVIIGFKWLRLEATDNNLFIALKTAHGAYGVVNIKGETIIPFNYTSIRYLGNGLFVAIEKDAVSTLVDMQNKAWFKTKDCTFERSQYKFGALQFLDTRNNKYGLITKEGKIIAEAKYDSIADFRNTAE